MPTWIRSLIFPLLIASFIAFSFVPTFYEIGRRSDIPTNRSFELIHNYYTDYNFYLSRIREGFEGRLTVVERYTSEAHAGSLIQVMYLGLGWLGRVVPDAAFAVPGMYHVARAVFGIVLLWLVAVFVKRHFSVSFPVQILAFLTAVTASSYPVIVPVTSSGVRFGGHMPWWTMMDSLIRMTFIPHILLGQALMIALIIGVGDMRLLSKSGNWIWFGVFSLILGLIFPPGLVFVDFVIAFLILIEILGDRNLLLFEPKKRISWIMSHIAPRVFIVIMGLPTIVYFQLMFSVYPWKRLVEFDAMHPITFSYIEYAKALGLTLPLGILGLLLVVIRGDKAFKQPVAWVVAWIFCLWIFQYIPQQSPLRFSEMMPHVPLAVLSVYLYMQVFTAVKSLIQKHASPIKKTGAVSTPTWGHIVYMMLYILVLLPVGLGIFFLYSMWLWQKDFYDQKIRAGWPYVSMDNYIVYPARGFTDMMRYIDARTPKDAIFLGDLSAGNYIPAMTGRTVYVGHENTVKKEEKLAESKFLLSGNMTIDQSLEFLKRHQISYIFFGPQERAYNPETDLLKSYPFLKIDQQNGDVTLYKVE